MAEAIKDLVSLESVSGRPSIGLLVPGTKRRIGNRIHQPNRPFRSRKEIDALHNLKADDDVQNQQNREHQSDDPDNYEY